MTFAKFKENNFFKIIVVLIICILCLTYMDKQVSASSASVNITAPDSKASKGDAVYVIITISSSETIGGFKGRFSYDSRVLKYVTGGSFISGNDNEFYVSDTERSEGSSKIKYAVKFIARANGTVSIKLKKPYAVYEEDGTTKMSISYNSAKIQIMDKAKLAAENTATPIPTKKPEENITPEPTITPTSKPKKKNKTTAKPKKNNNIDKSDNDNIEIKQNDTPKAKTANITYIIGGGVLILLICCILIIFIYRNNKRKRKKEAVIKEKVSPTKFDDFPDGHSWKR